MALASVIKDPEAKLDYTINWSAWLESDTIASVAFTVPTGLTKVSEAHTTTTATVWLEGGTKGNQYHVVCQVTTVGGRIDQRTIVVVCEDK